MFLYELLNEYEAYLEKNLSANSARAYADRLAILFEGQPLTNTSSRLEIEKIMQKLSEIKYKNHFSQAKNALLHFCKFKNISLSAEHLNTIHHLEQNTKKKYRKQKPYSFKDVDNTIKRIKNQKMKLSYQTILKTGLRISELASIMPNDCILSDDEISIDFIGKGGKTANVTIHKQDDITFFERLQELISQTKQGKKVFYSANYLQQKATEYGFNCHDLRSVFAIKEYHKTKSIKHVMEKLRHSNIKTTNIYLKRRIKI